jgi:hypothetical protein
MPTIAEKIQYAKISQYLAQKDIAIQDIFNGGSLDIRLPRLLYIVRSSVQWLYNLNPADTTLAGSSTYLYGLCGKYNIQAQTIAGNATPGIIINPTTGQPVNFETVPFQTVVGSGLLNPGDTVLTITDSNIINGSVSLSLDGVGIGIGLSDRPSYTIALNTIQLIITLTNQTFQPDQLVMVKYDKTI